MRVGVVAGAVATVVEGEELESNPPVAGDRAAHRQEEDATRQRQVRWVVGRTISWLKVLRRLRVRDDRLGVIRDALTTLAACVICFRILHHDCESFAPVLSEPITAQGLPPHEYPLAEPGTLRPRLPHDAPATLCRHRVLLPWRPSAAD